MFSGQHKAGSSGIVVGDLSDDGAAYSVANAARFGWGSVASRLPQGRLDLLGRYVVGPKVLDAGCGGGAYVDYLARAGYEVTGADKFDMFLQMAASKGLRGTFVKADLTDRLPFDDGAFDTTICFDVLEHVDDCAAIRELSRVTRQRLIVTVPRDDTSLTRFGLAPAPYIDRTHRRHYTEGSLRELMMTFGNEELTILDDSVIDLRSAALNLLTAQSRFPGLTTVYNRLLTFLLRRAESAGLYMNYAAIVDRNGRSS